MVSLLQRSVASIVSAGLCILATGCGKPVQVVVPEDFHGDLVVHCTSTGVSSRMLQANANGVADGVCPSMETGVRVFRGGQQVAIGSTGWTQTRDGIPTAIRIDVN